MKIIMVILSIKKVSVKDFYVLVEFMIYDIEDITDLDFDYKNKFKEIIDARKKVYKKSL